MASTFLFSFQIIVIALKIYSLAPGKKGMVEQGGKSTNYWKEISLGRKKAEFCILFWICPLSELLIRMGRPPALMLMKQLTFFSL